jgi:hypothetical protein
VVDQEVRHHRTITIQAGQQTLTAADPLPEDLQAAINAVAGTH